MNIPTITKIKLAKLLSFIKELPTDKGLIVVDGEVEVGTDVFIYDTENGGDVVPAPDGVYKTDTLEITVVSGKISEVKDIEAEPAPVVEETPAEPVVEEVSTEETPAEPAVEETPAEEKDDVEALNARIAELEAAVAEKDAKIAELEAEIAKYKEKEETPVADPAEDPTNVQMSAIDRNASNAMSIVAFLKK